MQTAKVFTNGRSQAVRIPKEYRFETDTVFINKIGSTVMLTPVSDLAETLRRGAKMLPDDFFIDEMPESIPAMREEL